MLAEAGAAGVLAERSSPNDPVLVDQLLAMGEVLALDLSVGTLAQSIGALGEVFGLLALELGGHLVGGFEPADSLFGHSLDELADRIGLPASTAAR